MAGATADRLGALRGDRPARPGRRHHLCQVRLGRLSGGPLAPPRRPRPGPRPGLLLVLPGLRTVEGRGSRDCHDDRLALPRLASECRPASLRRRRADARPQRRPHRRGRWLRTVVFDDVHCLVVGDPAARQGVARFRAVPRPQRALLAPLSRPHQRRPVRDRHDAHSDALGLLADVAHPGDAGRAVST